MGWLMNGLGDMRLGMRQRAYGRMIMIMDSARTTSQCIADEFMVDSAPRGSGVPKGGEGGLEPTPIGMTIFC